MRAVPRAMSTGHVPGPKKPKGATDDFLLDGVSSRYVPNYLTGQARASQDAFVLLVVSVEIGGFSRSNGRRCAGSKLGKGATIILRSSSPGFTDPSKPAYVFDVRLASELINDSPTLYVADILRFT